MCREEEKYILSQYPLLNLMFFLFCKATVSNRKNDHLENKESVMNNVLIYEFQINFSEESSFI